MEDEKTLADYGLSSSLAKAQSPAEVGLSFMNDGTFEELEKTPYSSPPELPDVMKPGQETTAQEATTAWTNFDVCVRGICYGLSTNIKSNSRILTYSLYVLHKNLSPHC